MARTVKRYTKEFKEEAVRLVLKSGSVKNTAVELGIPQPTLGGWMAALKKKGLLASADASSAKDMASLIEENRKLHKDLAIAREEREILKKAATYFAQHQK